jgi:hypothetical protein
MLTKALLVALLCAAVSVAAPHAQAQSARAAAAPPSPPVEAPIKADIDAIFGKLVDELRQADALAQHLRETAAKSPEDTKHEVDEAASTISRLADALDPNGQIGTRLVALRNASLVHRKRVQDLPKGAIEETDRSNILAAWDKVLLEADAASTAMTDMRDKLLATLQKLRMRQTAVSELLLAGQYKAALDTLMNWLTDLQGTVDGLHRSIDDVGTVLHGPDGKTS